jgi:hypothetical protein
MWIMNWKEWGINGSYCISRYYFSNLSTYGNWNWYDRVPLWFIMTFVLFWSVIYPTTIFLVLRYISSIPHFLTKLRKCGILEIYSNTKKIVVVYMTDQNNTKVPTENPRRHGRSLSRISNTGPPEHNATVEVTQQWRSVSGSNNHKGILMSVSLRVCTKCLYKQRLLGRVDLACM